MTTLEGQGPSLPRLVLKPAQLRAFTPFGRDFCKIHPFTASHAFNNIHTESYQRGPPPGKPTSQDDEIYVLGCTVVWSTGAKVVRTFTVDSPVQQALWCMLPQEDGPDPKPNGQTGPSLLATLCVVQQDRLDFFHVDGPTYTVPLPYALQKVWALPGGGLLLEPNNRNETLPTVDRKGRCPSLQVLLSPLEEPRPVLLRKAPATEAVRVVEVLPDMGIILTSGLAGHLAAWHVHRLSPSRLTLQRRDSSLEGNRLSYLGVERIADTVARLMASEPTENEQPSTIELVCVWQANIGQGMEVHSVGANQPAPGRWDWIKAGPAVPTIPEEAEAWAHERYEHAVREECVIDVAQGSARTHVKENLAQGRCFVLHNCMRWQNKLFSSHTTTRWQLGPEADCRKNADEHITQIAVRLPNTEQHQNIQVVAYFSAGSGEGMPQSKRRRSSSSNTAAIMHEAGTHDHGPTPFNMPNAGPPPYKVACVRTAPNQHALWILDQTRDRLHGAVFCAKEGSRTLEYQPEHTFSMSARDFALLSFPPHTQDEDRHRWRWVEPVPGDGLVIDLEGKLVLTTGYGEPLAEVVLPNLIQPQVQTQAPTSSVPQTQASGEGDLSMSMGSDMDVSMEMEEETQGDSSQPLPSSDPSIFTVTGLSDAVANQVTFHVNTDNGPRQYRARVSFVPSCGLARDLLCALQHALPRNTYLLVRSALLALMCERGQIGALSSHTETTCVLQSVRSMLWCAHSTSVTHRQSQEQPKSNWEALLASDHHKAFEMGTPYVAVHVHVQAPATQRSTHGPVHVVTPSEGCILLQCVGAIYEAATVCTLTAPHLQILADFLAYLAWSLGWSHHVDRYVRDGAEAPRNEASPAVVPESPVSLPLLQRIEKIISGEQLQVDGVALLPGTHQHTATPAICRWAQCIIDALAMLTSAKVSDGHRAVVHLAACGFDPSTLDCVPAGVGLPIREAIHACRSSATTVGDLVDGEQGSKANLYRLIGREDLLALETGSDPFTVKREEALRPVARPDKDDEDPFDASTRLTGPLYSMRFAADRRLDEVRRILISHRPPTVRVDQLAHRGPDLLAEQQLQLLSLVTRSMALGPGRGMFLLSSARPVVSEPLVIPPISYIGRLPGKKASVTLEQHTIPPVMSAWAEFHNGVAAGLRIAPDIGAVSSTWIAYNRPQRDKTSHQAVHAHAGFLMALGLQGHLHNLAKHTLQAYLSERHDTTSVGLLLGMAASYRGTMDTTISKVLSIHIPAMLPLGSAELDVPEMVQTAALLATGLLYQGTANRHICNVLLGELKRRPQPGMTSLDDRESYALAAGLALGLVTLGTGDGAGGLSDMQLSDQLRLYMDGGMLPRKKGSASEATSSNPPIHSNRIAEGPRINTDVTAPAAIAALALMHLQTNNTAVAQLMDLPDTHYLLDQTRPDFLLLRVLARGLIMWDTVEPSYKWIRAQVPQFMADTIASTAQEPESIYEDKESLMMANYCVLAGGALAIGFRFAGSANADAFAAIMECACLLRDADAPGKGKDPVRGAARSGLYTAMLGLGMVMAGTGNLQALRFMRQIRTREMRYGGHMAVHMAVGLLFLGGGLYTLRTTKEAVAALLCSLYPVFPVNSGDGIYHLQAFRHLYVLAVEPRAVVTQNIETGEPCHVPLDIYLTGNGEDAPVRLFTPCILPELSATDRIEVAGPRYWPITLDPRHLHEQIQSGHLPVLYVKKRIGYLDYKDDPTGLRHIVAHFGGRRGIGVGLPRLLRTYTSDAVILAFADLLGDTPSRTREGGDGEETSFCGSVLQECVANECPEMIGSYLALWAALRTLKTQPSIQAFWSLQIAVAYYHALQSRGQKTVVQGVFLQGAGVRMREALAPGDNGPIRELLRAYLIESRVPGDRASRVLLGTALTYNRLPCWLETKSLLNLQFAQASQSDHRASVLPLLLRALPGVDPQALVRLLNLLV